MQKLSFMHRLTLGILVSVILFGVCFTYMTGITTAVNGIATYYPYQIPTIVNGTVTYTYMQIRPPFPQPFWELVFSFSVAFIPITIVIWQHQQTNGETTTSELTATLKDFLAQFKENKSAAIGRGYDPDPRRHKRSHGRRGGLPKSLIRKYGISKKAWQVFRGGRTHDPGRAKYKPLHYGHRGGTYFQGPTRRRYDPAPRRFERLRSYGRRARGYGGKIEGGVNRYGGILGFFGALIYGSYTGYAAFEKAFKENGWNKDNPLVIDGVSFTCAWDRYLYVLQREGSQLWSPHEGWDTVKYLRYKFTGVDNTDKQVGSAWVVPFWVSLIATLAGPIAKLFTNKGQRILRPIHKVGVGALAASTIGALALPGCGENSGLPQPPPPNSMNQGKPNYSAPVRTIEFTYRG
jgi:hypothetical protein